MADLIGDTIARNYLKAVETSKMGTRQLVVLVVDMQADVTTNYTDSNSLFAKAVRGLETLTELYVIFPPSGNLFTVLAADDTLPFNASQTPGDGNRITKVETALNSATGATTHVWNATLAGTSFSYND